MAQEDNEEDFPGRLLHQAALWGNAELLEDLLHGEMIEFLNAKDCRGRTALHAAATNENETCTRILLQAGADPNIACGAKEQFKTALHLAAENGQLDIARLLLEYEADLLAKDSSGLTAMDLAEKADQPHVMELLKEAANDREQHREELHVALWEACSKGDVSKAKQLIKQLGRETELIINSTPNGCSTLLFKACEEGQKEIVKLLLESGADGRIHPVTKYSPLYIACYYGRKDIVEILLKKFPELVIVATVEKWLPIHAAVINGHVAVLDLLLKFTYDSSVLQKFMDKTQLWEYSFPFDINAKDVTEQTVLYVACLVGNQRIVDLLLKFRVSAKRIKKDDSNSDQESKNEGQKLDLVISPTKKRLSNGIQSMISKLSLRNSTEKEEERTEVEISPLDLDLYCNNNTETALHIAVKKKYHNIVILLLQNGANPNLSIKQSAEELNRANDNSGSTSTALVEACKNRDVNMVDCLVRHGARDDNCKALKVASSNSDEYIASKLLTLKAYQDPEFKINKKALEIVPSAHLGGILGSVTFSSMFPTTPVMINWHGQKCLHYIKEEWLINASMAHNVKLKLTARNQSSALMAITRLDISNNQLTELPLCIFQMSSLRHFNAANNKIYKLPEAGKANSSSSSSSPKTALTTGKRDPKLTNQSGWCCPVLEEIHLHDNRLDSVPSCLFTLPALTILDLSNNKLQTLPFKMWSAPKLRELNLSLNMLHDLPSKPPPSRSISASRLAPSISEDMVNSAESSPRHSTIDGSSFDGSTEIPNLLSPTVEANRFKVDGDLRQQELLHHNLWSATVKIVESANDNETDKNQKCQLAALNLAHNAYDVVPPILSCFAVNLARLNMSYNRLTEMGPVSSYPGCLKHLDLSHNHIKTWFSSRRIDPDLNIDGTGCYSQFESPSTKPKSSVSSSSGRTQSPSLHSWGSAKSLTGSVCQHRRHTRLDNLRTLILADNDLDRLILMLDEEDFEEEDSRSSESFEAIDATGKVVIEIKNKILFPNLSMLDVSNNRIIDVPAIISEFSNLSVLNLSGNGEICHLPPEMGLLSKLWNLNTRMCNLSEPLRSMIDSKKYKTMDVIGYLKSILEDAKPYARMKLMIVGIEGIGKTSLLEQLRMEGTGTYRKKPPEHWAKRTGNKNINLKTAKGINISTVGVDVGDWMYEKKIRGHSSYGPVVFRTWDFGGQKEYYATHQYFLSKRSLYLVVWRIIDGERGVDGILQWLVNIQARAPNAPVIIIGTHYDLVKERFPPSYSEDLQQMIRDRFINVVDADKCGLPRVIDTIEISCKTRHNIKLLCNLIYDTVFDLKCPGSKERLLEQKIPATYLALEDVVGLLAVDRHVQGKDPVLRAEPYRNLVMHEMMHRYNIAFRDISELNQATTFLHENGILLHYEDATLKDLYFLDPQWLCDMLAHVVTIREINPFARNGIMKIEDLKHVFKSSQFAPSDAQTYILNLLNKFEVALTWDNRTLIIPSLLPSEEQLRAGFPGCDVRVPVRSRVWAMRKSYGNRHSVGSTPLTLKLTTTERRPQRPLSDIPLTTDSISSPKVSDPLEKDSDSATAGITCYVRHKTQIESVIRRLLLMSYFPSGFWSRLMTRMLADDIVVEIIRSYFLLPKDVDMDPLLAAVFNRRAEWICWQTGMELRYLDTTLFRMKEHLSHLNNAPFEYRQMKFFVQQEGSWSDIEIINSAILEIILPNQTVVIQIPKVDSEGIVVAYDNVELQPNSECVAKLLSVSVDHIDTLLEDWYPTLGTRFVHTSEGKFLVTRLVPCTQCIVAHLKEETGSSDKGHFSVTDHAWEPALWHGEPPWKGGVDTFTSRNLSSGSSKLSYSPNLAQRNRGSRNSTMSHDSDSGVGPDSNSSSRKPSTESRPEGDLASSVENNIGIEPLPETVIYSFMVEECILTAYEQRSLQCPLHGNQSLLQIAPDTVFVDLGERYLIPPDSVRRGKMLGRGAFGFVFKANIKQRGCNTYTEVAMKMLQPVDPGFGAKQSDTAAYKAAWNKWQRDPLQYACKAYCTARQELNILLSLRHQNIVPLVGVCTRPLALVLQLAPMGALDSILKNYRRSGAKLDVYVVQKIIFQIAKALEYLHQQHIIYRDLKSENVLVWELPPPFHPSTPIPALETKLADYGISRSTLPTGTKGFGGTEGFMAPEIMRYNGEEEYTEKVDCFSFGMFMYELITLHQPFEGQECVKDHILDGGRPSLTKREMSYPTYILDLMTLCWSQQPKDRPSASQIVSIAQAPELTHLIDVASLHDQMAVLSACVTALPPKNEEQSVQDDQWELWFSRLGKQMDILTCSQKSWLEYKTLTLETVTVTCLCVVGDDLWLGDSKARIHIYSIADHTMTMSFPVDPHAPTVSAIRSMCTLPGQNGVAMATSGGQLWLCCTETTKPEETEEKSDGSDNPHYNIEELSNRGGSIFCITAIDLGNKSCELWCGQTQGKISIYSASESVVTSQEIVYHYDPIVDNLDVYQLVGGFSERPIVWSYVYPGCVAYQWDTANRTILHKLDCSKLAPCSESLMSISIEEHLSPGRCQVTAMASVGSDLYIGTTWGCIVVAEGTTMRPVTVFRPFEEEVKAILPLLGRKVTENKDCPSQNNHTVPYIATVGKGYRNLIGRYASINAPALLQDNMYLLLWRADNWAST